MEIVPITKEAYDLYHEGALAFARAEQVGIHIDVEYCQQKQAEINEQMNKVLHDMEQYKLIRKWQHKYGKGYNWKSNQQLAKMLYEIEGIKPTKMAAGGEQGSTDEETLGMLGLPELHLLIKARKLEKLKNTYLAGFLREQINGVVHPFINSHKARTGRPSIDSPNFANIPKRDDESMQMVRSAVYPRKGHQIGEVDFGSIEIMMACCYTEDPKLIYDAVEGDMHKDMAIELYMMDGLDKSHPGEYKARQGGKNGYNFPEFYGDYYVNCAANLLEWAKIIYLRDNTPMLVHLAQKGLITLTKTGQVKDDSNFVEHVRKIEDNFWNVRYKTYTAWKKRWYEDYCKRGYFDMFTGFRCQGLMNRKEAINYPFQGTAFHCLLWSFTRIDERQRAESWDTKQLFQIYDSDVLDFHPDETKYALRIAKQIMTVDLPAHWPWIIVPLEVEADVAPVDRPWSEKAFYEIS